MGLKCGTYGGTIGWFIRKRFSTVTSYLYLKYQFVVRRKLFNQYINYFKKKLDSGIVQQPCLISIETINRCNGTCGFCPANRNEDKRPFAKMDEELFHKIISELEEWNYDGYLNLYVNNEPFMDTRIEEWYKYAKHHLPKAKMLLYTNGTLISKERFDKIIPYIDKMIVNNYTDKNELNEDIAPLYEYIKSIEAYRNKDITFQIRYNQEILTNRAGSAPNNSRKKIVHDACIMPFTDITIFPNGTLGLCCNDATEKTNLGTIRDNTIQELWSSDLYQSIRKKVGADRSTYGFCSECDFVDAGIRNGFIKKKLGDTYE